MLMFLAAISVLLGFVAAGPDDEHRPVSASIHLHLNAPVERAFPMFDPVNETRWSPDWHPTLLGDKRVAAGLVFTTDTGPDRATWLLDRYDPASGTIRYVVTRRSVLGTIDISVVPDGANASSATITYTHTALDPGAVDEIHAFAKHFPRQQSHWESAINAALAAATST